jgi:tRNA (cytidine/uridine-2'-O-)-methyltransferase
MRLALFQPDIPQNLGAGIRLCACLSVELDIIEPCGFALSDKSLTRAAMDYGKIAQIQRHNSWSDFQLAPERQNGRLILLTTKAAVSLYDFSFRSGDTLLLGRESAGVPDEVHAAAAGRLFVPLAPQARSLNVIVAGAMALGEAMRQRRLGDNLASLA